MADPNSRVHCLLCMHILVVPHGRLLRRTRAHCYGNRAFLPRQKHHNFVFLKGRLLPNIIQSLMPNIIQSLMPNIIQSLMPNIIQSLMSNIIQPLMPNIIQSLMPNIIQPLMPNIIQSLVPNHSVSDA